SNAPYLLRRAREGMRLGHGELLDAMIVDGLWEAYEDYHMGCCGENVAEKYHVGRQEQDEYALRSHQKAVAAIKAGKFKDEIVPVPIPQKKGDAVAMTVDETPREDTTLDALARLKPAFREGGTVTAGNAPGVNDGAGARAEPDGADRGPGELGRRAGDGDDGSGRRRAADLAEDGLDPGHRGPVRAERGLRRAGGRGHEGAG